MSKPRQDRSRAWAVAAFGAAVLVAPTWAAAQTPRQTHPYLTFSDAHVTRFKQRVSQDPAAAAAWSGARTRADLALKRKPANDRELNGDLMALALTYRMTGQARYADEAKTLLDTYAARASWVTDKPLLARDPAWRSDLGMGTSAYTFGLAYDAVYDALTPEDRRRLAGGLVKGAIAPVLNDWIDGAQRIHSLDTMGHNWWSHIVFGAGVAAIAVMNDEPRAQAWVARLGEAGGEWVNYAGSAIETKPRTFAANGAFTESINYADFATEGYLRFRRAWKDAFAEPLADEPLLAGVGDYFLQNSYPTTAGVLSVNFGDGAPTASGASAISQLWALGDHDPAYLWYLRGVAAANPEQDVWTRPEQMVLWPTAAETAAAAAPALPHSWIDPDLGSATLRSSWDANATFVALRSGFTWNHNHADAGSFILWHGGQQLLIDSGNSTYARPEYDGYYRQSVAHNVVTVDGDAEPASNTYDGSAFPGVVEHLIDDGDLRYVWSDATGPNARAFARKFRSLLWIGDTILVLDDVKAWKPGQFDWLLHYEGQANRRGQVITVKNGEAEVAVQPLFPEPLPDGGLPTDYPEALRLIEDKGLKDHAPDTVQPFLRLRAAGLVDRTKFVVALTPKTNRPAPRIERFETKDYLGVRLRQAGQVTEVYVNLLADGRIRHRNANARLGPWETDAYLLAVTYPDGGEPSAPTRWFAADASYLRREGKVELDSLSKVFATMRQTAAGPVATLQAQPVHAVRIACGAALTLSANGRATPCADGVAVLKP